MSFQTFVTERLKSITETLNAIGTNAKKIDELPVQSILDPTSKIHISKGGVSESLEVQKIIDVISEKNYSQLLEVGEITISGLTISVPANAMWVYEGVNHQTVAITEIPETLCDAGFLRNDILVANQSNQIVLIKGIESQTIRIPPSVPTGSVFVSDLDIDDTVIGTPSAPILNGDYIPKIDKSHVLLQSTGVVDFYSIGKGKYNGIVFDGTYTSFGGVSYIANSSCLFPGRKFTIRNNQSTAITLLHNSNLAAVKLMFPNLVDFIIKPKEVIEFIYRVNTNASGWYDYVGNINDIPLVEISDVVGLPEALDLKFDTSAYNQHFRGVYLTELALNTALPTANVGDYAQVNVVGATDAVNYNWDAEENIWVINAVAGSGALNTDQLPEGSANLYFTTARVSGKEDAANKSQDIETDKLSTTKYGSIKAIYDWAVAKFQAVLVSGTNIKTINGTSILGSGDVEISAGSSSGIKVWNVKDYGTVADGVTDDTVKIQDTINACFAAGGGVIYFPNGVYIIGGSLVTSDNLGANPNSQLYIPATDSDSANKTAITFLGETEPNFTPSAFTGTFGPTMKGVVLLSTLTTVSGVNPSVFGTKHPTSYANINYTNVSFEKITVLVNKDPFGYGPVIGGLNMANTSTSFFNKVVVNINGSMTANTNLPTAEIAGIVVSKTNAEFTTSVKNTIVTGFRYGIIIGEHCSMDQVAANGCFAGFVFMQNNHTVVSARIFAGWNKYSLYFPTSDLFGMTSGIAYISLFDLDIEIWYGTSKWNNSTYIVYDPSNYAKGNVKWHIVQAGVGAVPSLFNKSGGVNLGTRQASLPIQYYDTTSVFGLGTAIPTTFVNQTGITGGIINVKAAGTDYARLYAQGGGGGIMALADLGATANRKQFQLRSSLGKGSVEGVNDNGTALTHTFFTFDLGSGNSSFGSSVDDGVNKLQVSGSVKSTQFRLSALNTAPTSSTATGTLGEIRVVSDYIYVCIATNTWVRAALTTW